MTPHKHNRPRLGRHTARGGWLPFHRIEPIGPPGAHMMARSLWWKPRLITFGKPGVYSAMAAGVAALVGMVSMGRRL